MGHPFTTIGYRGNNSQRLHSGGIWWDCPDQVQMGTRGVYMFDDFTGLDGSVSSNVGRWYSAHSYRTYEDNSCTFLPIATYHQGAARLTTDTTGNNEVWAQVGGAAGVHCLISDTAGSAYPMWFECRIRADSATDSIFTAFVGLGEEGLAAADTITDGDALASKDLVGFFHVGADGDQWDTVHRLAGGAATTVKSDAFDGTTNPHGTIPSAFAADTWYKLGMKYVPHHPDGARLEYYINGLLLPDSVEGNTLAATFPDGQELAFLIGFKNVTTTAVNLDLDWWAFAQDEISKTSI